MIGRKYRIPVKRFVVAAGIIVVAWMPVRSGSPDGNHFLEVNKSIDIFGRVYKEISSNYVDEIQPSKFMDVGIEAMLGSLDPYTVYIDRDNGEEVELLTSGKYGGIGVTIGYRDGTVQVMSVMDGYSAQRQGLIPGDRILEVDDTPVKGKKPDVVRNLTRGAPGTEVRLLIDREGETDPLAFVLIREEIRLRNVTYATRFGSDVGYVRLERFSRNAGEEVRQAIKDLRKEGEIRGMILDLRGNPGGLLEAAVEVVSKFVPRGSEIVSTKGRRPESAKSYQSSEEPLASDIPLVVLTDRESASASEIVSGAIQDLDRGLIVGDRTFGKGLVQTIIPLNYGAQLKVTTARYYIPSGRSIQEIDYENRTADGVFAPYADTARHEFRTIGGRLVYEHGGIAPDSVVLLKDEGPMISALLRKAMFFRFMNAYVAERKEHLNPRVTEEMVLAFRTFLDEQNFEFEEDTERAIRELRESASDLLYADPFMEDINRLSEKVQEEKRRAFDRFRDHITHHLQIELSARVNGEQGRIEAQLERDIQLETALRLLKDADAYGKKISG